MTNLYTPLDADTEPRKRPAGRKSRRAPGSWGSVEQLPSGRWRAFYRIDGARISAPQTFPTKAAAHAWLATEQADHSRGVWSDPRQGALTFGEYATTWLATRTDLSPRTAELYDDSLRRWILPTIDGARRVTLGSMLLTKITPAIVRIWFAAVHDTARRDGDQRAANRVGGRQTHPARVWAKEAGYTVASSGRLSPAILEAWQLAGSPVPATPTTGDVPHVDRGRTAAAQAYRLLRSILNTAVREGALTANPCQIPRAGSPRPRERGTASPAEVDSLSAAMPAHLSAAVLVAAWGSLRYGELFALARRHVDLAAGTIRIERAVIELHGQPLRFGPTKTLGSSRLVHLPAFVLDALQQHLSAHVEVSPDALLFTTTTGGAVSKSRLHSHFHKARAAIGRTDLTWHDLRHTGATLAYKAGASVPEVQARLGHTTNRAAMLYAHTTHDSDRILAGRLDALNTANRSPLSEG